MKISIIIPVFNVEQYIEQCLDSVFSQHIPLDYFEVIIVNDGTPDRSMAIVEKFEKYTNLKIIEQTNQGLSAARNKGLAYASGDYIWFVDSDDWISDNALKTLLPLVEEYNADVYATAMQRIEEHTKISYLDISSKTDVLLEDRKYLFGRYPTGASQRFILKRSFLLKNKLEFYPKIFHEDNEFGFRMLYLAKDVYVLEKPIYYYRLRQHGSIMSSWKKKNSEDLIFIHKRIDQFISKIQDSDEKDKFKIKNFENIESSIRFARRDFSTPEFKIFFNENKSYLQKEARKLLKSKSARSEGIGKILKYSIMAINPATYLLYITLKNK